MGPGNWHGCRTDRTGCLWILWVSGACNRKQLQNTDIDSLRAPELSLTVVLDCFMTDLQSLLTR